MKRKKSIILLLFFLLTAFVSAQPPRGGHHGKMNPKEEKKHLDEIRAHKVGFITERLSLTSEEAIKFWPVYNEFDTQMINMFVEMRSLEEGLFEKDIESMSDAEVDSYIKKMEDIKNREFQNFKTLNEKLSKVISKKKILMLSVAEHDFRRNALHKFKKDH